MTLSSTNLGGAQAASGASPTTISTAAALAVGDVIVVVMAYDNSGGSGADPLTNFAVTPATGSLSAALSTQTGLNDPGAASAGLAARCNAYRVTGAIASGQNISISWTGTVVVRAIRMVKISSSLGSAVLYRTNSGSTGTNQTATGTPALATPSVNTDELVLCWAGHENGANITGDADTTNGSWSAILTNFQGSGATGMALGVQTKVVTATGVQNFNPTGTSSDWILGALIFFETISGTVAQTTADFTSSASGRTGWAVTARQNGNSNTSQVATHTSSSDTPSPDSLYIRCVGATGDSNALAWQTPTDGGLSYTQLAAFDDGSGTIRTGMQVHRANIGGSPSAFTVTADAFSTAATGWYSETCFDITGGDLTNPIVGSVATNGGEAAGSSSASGTVTLGATPTAGNLIVVVITVNPDASGASASPTAGSGKTFQQTFAQTTGVNISSVWYRVADGAESTTITCSDLGQIVSGWTMTAFEVAKEGSGPTGTVAATMAAFTSSASGTVINPVTGTVAATMQAFTSTASGTETVSGSVAATLQDFTSAANGTVANPVTGTAAVTLQNFTSTANGTETISGSVAATLAHFTSAASGTETLSGSSAQTLHDFTATAAGSVINPISGSVAAVLQAFTSTATGTETISGTVAATMANFTSAASGAETLSGSSAQTLQDFAGSASGTVLNPITGTAAAVLEDATSDANGTVTIAGVAGSVDATMADFTATASGTVVPPSVTGTAAVTLQDFTASASGDSISGITGSAGVTLQDFAAAASGDVTSPAVTGSVAVTLQDALGSASGLVANAVAGAVAAVMADMLSAAAGIVANPVTMGDVSVIVSAGTRVAVGASGAAGAGARIRPATAVQVGVSNGTIRVEVT